MSWDAATKYKLLLHTNNAIVKYTNRDQLFRSLASELMAICHYDRLSINLYDEKTESLSYFGNAAGVSPEAISYDERPLGKGAIAQEVIRSQKPLIIRRLKKRSYWSSVRAMIRAGLTSSMAFPLMARGKILGVVHISFKQQPPNIKELAEFLGEFSEVVAVAVDNMLAYTELKKSNRNLVQQKHFLMENADAPYNPDAFFYSSSAMKEVMRQVALIAPTDASVLITGETGTGKDYVARYIHRLSQRREALFVKVNCPALSASLFESELFGHSKGAFTGAVSSRVGRFEMADGGTIFLDEIGELPATSRPSFCMFCRTELLKGWATTAAWRLISGFWPPPTATWSWRWGGAVSVRISTTA